MNFLQLCQTVAEEIGIPSGGPTTVGGQTGELRKVVRWVRDAWIQLQMKRQNWRFMWKTFEVTWASGQTVRSAGILGLTDLSRFDPNAFAAFPILRPDEKRPLRHLPYESFNALYEQQPAQTGGIEAITVRPDNALAVARTPVEAWRLAGRYYRKPQTLLLDSDIPICQDKWHESLVWYAIARYAGHDEAPQIYAHAATNAKEFWNQFVREELPQTGVDAQFDLSE